VILVKYTLHSLVHFATREIFFTTRNFVSLLKRPCNILDINSLAPVCWILFWNLTFSSWPGLDHYCRTAFSILIKQILFKTKDAFSQAANHPARVKLEFHEAHKEFTNQGDFSLSFNHLGSVHSAPEKFENAAGFLQLGQPSTLIRLENALQNGAIEKT